MIHRGTATSKLSSLLQLPSFSLSYVHGEEEELPSNPNVNPIKLVMLPVAASG